MNDIECKGVVVGTDGSFGSLRAVDWAAVEAEILGVPLTLCCVGASTPATPTPALFAASARASLLVVGSRGHGGVTGMLRGSVSQHVVRHSQCPVAVVPG